MKINSQLKTYQYTLWIIAALVCGLLFPSFFLHWGNFDLRNKYVILFIVQLVMFGMGTQMSLSDLKNFKNMKKGIIVGIICQFTIMPLVGFMLTKIFHFEPEISAGIILIGSCSSGLASNVMSYIAGANLPLSIALTTLATLLAPIMTPLWMKLLAGTYVEVSFVNMCIEIVKIIIVPVGAAFIAEGLRNGNQKLTKNLNIIVLVSLSIFIPALLFLILSENTTTNQLLTAELICYICGALMVGWLYSKLLLVLPKVQKHMPKLSMFGIIYFTAVTTAASRENILTIGFVMLLAAIIHNTLGYFLGYNFSKLMGLDKNSCRTIALEVGMQNGGMASGLAGVLGKLSTMGLAAAIFSPWMNFSGSLIANRWKKNN